MVTQAAPVRHQIAETAQNKIPLPSVRDVQVTEHVFKRESR